MIAAPRAAILRLEASEVDDDKGKKALAQYTLHEVELSDRASFEAAYGALDAEFGARGELERREVLERWLSAPLPRPYHLLVARDASGAISAIRDCHVKLDVKANAVVAYLAHVLVLPEHRRSGLASLMRAAPLALARRASAALPEADILVAAEMEPVEPSAVETIVRLVAYGRAGFAAVEPASLPYCQPDFRDLAALGESPKPLPLLAVVRWVGHETAGALPKALARAYVDALYSVFATHCRAQDIEELRARTLRALEAHPGPDAPLLALPKSMSDEEPLRPLLRDSVLALHPRR